MVVRSPLLNVMARAADRAARHLKRDFGEVENLQVSRKGPADFVSTADRQAERILLTELKKARPDFGYLAEEGGASEPSAEGKRWIIDPLDGTTNFLHGLPHFAISIAAEDRGELIAALVYDPIKEEVFTAEKGGGAFLNDRRLRVSARDKLEDSLLATGIPFKGHGNHALFTKDLERVMGSVAGVRRWGTASLDLAYVAAGRFDAYWERDLSPWDVAAGILLVREAGGYVTDLEGKPYRFEGPGILATNANLQKQLQGLFSRPSAATKES